VCARASVCVCVRARVVVVVVVGGGAGGRDGWNVRVGEVLGDLQRCVVGGDPLDVKHVVDDTSARRAGPLRRLVLELRRHPCSHAHTATADSDAERVAIHQVSQPTREQKVGRCIEVH
jgi:hypothetical protein